MMGAGGWSAARAGDRRSRRYARAGGRGVLRGPNPPDPGREVPGMSRAEEAVLGPEAGQSRGGAEGGRLGAGGRAVAARGEPDDPGGRPPARGPQDAAEGQAARRGGRPADAMGGDGRALAGRVRAKARSRRRVRRRGRTLGVPADPDDRSAAGQGSVAGSPRRSTPSSWPGSKPRGSPRRRRPTGGRSSAAPRSTSGACRRRPRRSTRSRPTTRPTPTPGWSTACWPRRGTASAGDGTGSTSPDTPTPRATSSPRSVAIPTPSPTATT